MLPTAEQPISPLDENPLDENVNNLKLKASSANDKEDGSYNLKAVQQDGTIDDNDALRKLLDIDRIFRSVHSGPILPEHRSPSPNTRDDSSQVIGNPLSFYYSNDDKESRYDEDRSQRQLLGKSKYPEDEQQLPNRFELVDDEDINKAPPRKESSRPTHSRSATLSGFMQSRILGRSTSTNQEMPNTEPEFANLHDALHPREDSTKSGRFKKTLRRFNRRKTKDKRQSTMTAEFDELNDESENATIERAEKLLAGMSTGAPAINLMASCLLEDEHGITRAPLLLSVLGFKLSDVTPKETSRNRRFRIDLEYGIDKHRMKWSIERNATDLAYLAYKLERTRIVSRVVGNKSQPLPRLPIPPIRKLDNKRSKKTKSVLSDLRARDDRMSVPDINDNHSLSPVPSALSRVRLRLGSITSVGSLEKHPELLELRRKKNAQFMKDVESYLKELIEITELKTLANILFTFFELSPLSSLLSYESGYTGKQGPVHIGGTAKAQGWRVGHFKVNDLKGIYERRVEKWMLVRNSYITYVSDINSTTPLDVFLVDSDFKISARNLEIANRDDDDSLFDNSSVAQQQMHENENKFFPHLKITLENRERKLVMLPKSQREHSLWIDSLRTMQNLTIWSQNKRFDSFAPVRENCFAQWFVDARDYFWAVSTALEMAKDTIMIHDWWLSPELYLRRPANGNQQYRIDRLLQRKAKEGVKIFVIIYRNVGTTVATDSLYTKHSILSLDEENIHVIRSPNQLLQNTFFWAHHEKLCIIDHTYAFLGGIDLCYGRYDTPDHALTDDSGVDFSNIAQDDRITAENFANFQVFVGKDYSNPRVKDFLELEKPYESMYNRNIVPRMPWHDVHMYTCGQTARDLSRHFVQRWNYLIRQKRPSRLTPLLLPPSDLTEEEVLAHGLDGTCEVQLLRSSGNWSLGLKEHEQSIQNAYLKLIETSEHFVYIENQFFVTACFIDGTEIKNRIGDALVDRIIRAHREGTNWKAIIVIPLMPGFEAQVDEAEGSSVRVIMQCQYMSISRGETSIFAKLRKKGIDPDQYIQFFSLRKWGRIGSNRTLVTEQLYIHAKTMIVDDRSVIIGSANINERSMRGLRDSEVAAVVRDKEMVKSKMNGKPYMAAKFAHTLRMRLMREHLGVNIDIVDVVERRFKRFENFAASEEGKKFATNKFRNPENRTLSAMVEIASRDILQQPEGTRRWKEFIHVSKYDAEIAEVNFEEEDTSLPPPLFLPISFNNRTGPFEANKGVRDSKKHSYDNRVQNSESHKKDVYGEGLDKYRSKLAKRARVSSGKFLNELSLLAMETNPTGSFLPDFDSVRNFLESDDCHMSGEMDDESEDIIAERNKERWMLLKKISYLQRLAAREKSMNDTENQKRAKLGLPLLSKTGNAVNGNESQELPVSATLPISEGIDTDFSLDKEFPTVSLSEPAARDIINNLTTPDAAVSNFVDPYEFEDPIDPDFYEARWNEFARRNTDIYRMVFHCQPDDVVGRWSEYTHFTKLQSMFMKAQDTDTDQGQLAENYSDEKVEAGDNQEPRRANNSKLEKIDEASEDEYGLLGKAPPERGLENQNKLEQETNLRAKLSRRVSTFAGVTENRDKHFSDKAAPKSEGELQGGEKTSTEEEESEESGTPTDKPSATAGTVPASKTRKRARTYLARRKIQTGDVVYDKNSAERLLNAVQGHLVYFPAEWLSVELRNNNWFYNTDRLPPMEIYD